MKTINDIATNKIANPDIEFREGFIVQDDEKNITLQDLLSNVLDQWVILHLGNTGYTDHNKDLLLNELMRIIKNNV